MKTKTLVTAVLILFLTMPAAAGSVPDTGQAKCYDNEKQIPCPKPGEPFFGQDGNYITNTQSYTKLDSAGNALPDSATQWVMVRDNVTGLIWEVKNNMDGVADYTNPHDADNTYTWYDSNSETNGGYAGTPGEGTDTEDFIKALNTAKFGGYSDWRLPSVKEWVYVFNWDESIVNKKYLLLILGSPYWSSSTSAYDNRSAWFIYANGAYNIYRPKGLPCLSCAVRGGQ